MRAPTLEEVKANLKTKLFGTTNPAKGTATLKFSALYPGDHMTRDGFECTIRLRGKPWVQTGIQPFNWDFVPIQGDREFGIIRIVCDRDVSIEGEARNPFYDEARWGELVPMDAGHPKNGRGKKPKDIFGFHGCVYQTSTMNPYWGWLFPKVQIIRPQRRGTIPHSEDRIRTVDLLGPPYYLSGHRILNSDRPQGRHCKVITGPTGFYISHVEKDWEVIGRIKNALEPASFYFQIADPFSDKGTFDLLIVHNQNFDIKVSAVSRKSHIVKVVSRDLDGPVPFQGEPITEEEHPEIWKKKPKFHKPKTDFNLAKELFTELETAIGFVPLVGDVYDIAQFAYAAATGETFTGEDVSDSELMLLGGSILLPACLGKALR